MALTNTDNPLADKPADKPEPKPAKSEPAPPALGRAAESGDAGVHILLAVRQTHMANGDTAGVAAVDEQLAEFGLAV